MELATGKVRYEFSGPGAYGWFAAFTADGSAFLASNLFGAGIQVWPTAHTPEKGRTPPKPSGTVAVPKGMVLAAHVSSRGQVAALMHDGSVQLRALQGKAPRLANLPGKGGTAAAFSRDGMHVVGIRAGKAYVWSLAPARRTD